MFDLKKTITLVLIVASVLATAIASFQVGKKIGYNEGVCDEQYDQHHLIIRQDSLLRVQTERCHRLMDALYADKFVSEK